MSIRKTARLKRQLPASQPRVHMEEKTDRKKNNMVVLIIAFIAGMVIAALFRSLKITVPVPHDMAGLVGLIGMFVGSAIVDLVAKYLAK